MPRADPANRFDQTFVDTIDAAGILQRRRHSRPDYLRGYRVAETVVKNFWRHVKMAEEISLEMSVGCFALVVGVLSVYAVRAYLVVREESRIG